MKRSVSRGEVITSTCHGSKISGTQQTMVCKYCRKNSKNLHVAWLALSNKTVAHNLSSIFRQCKFPSTSQERLLRPRNFSSMVTYTSSLYYIEWVSGHMCLCYLNNVRKCCRLSYWGIILAHQDDNEKSPVSFLNCWFGHVDGLNKSVSPGWELNSIFI